MVVNKNEINEEELDSVTGGAISPSGVNDYALVDKLHDKYKRTDENGVVTTYEIVDIYKDTNTSYKYVLKCIETGELIHIRRAGICKYYTEIK